MEEKSGNANGGEWAIRKINQAKKMFIFLAICCLVLSIGYFFGWLQVIGKIEKGVDIKLYFLFGFLSLPCLSILSLFFVIFMDD